MFEDSWQVSARTNAAQTLTTEMLQSVHSSSSDPMRQLKYLLVKSYLQGLDIKQKTGACNLDQISLPFIAFKFLHFCFVESWEICYNPSDILIAQIWWLQEASHNFLPIPQIQVFSPNTKISVIRQTWIVLLLSQTAQTEFIVDCRYAILSSPNKPIPSQATSESNLIQNATTVSCRWCPISKKIRA